MLCAFGLDFVGYVFPSSKPWSQVLLPLMFVYFSTGCGQAPRADELWQAAPLLQSGLWLQDSGRRRDPHLGNYYN